MGFSQKKQTILFDIDGTLIDSEKLMRLRLLHLRQSFSGGRLQREITAAVRAIVSSLQFQKNPEIFFGSFLGPEIMRQARYPDVLPIFADLSKRYILGVWSQSIRAYQIYKLIAMDVLRYIHPDWIIIAPDKITALNTKLKTNDSHIVLVDNKPGKLDRISAIPPNRKWFINRDNRIVHTQSRTIHSLKEIQKVELFADSE